MNLVAFCFWAKWAVRAVLKVSAIYLKNILVVLMSDIIGLQTKMRQNLKIPKLTPSL